jgi:protein-disulfide isomerase
MKQPTNKLAVPVSERDHIRGPADAPVTLVVYGDYECPWTRKARTVIRATLRRLSADGGQGLPVRYVYRNFPLREKHPHAQQAAEAAEAAAAQGKFWEMYDLMLDLPWALEVDDLIGNAAKLGLDVDRFRRELTQHEHAARVEEDIQSGRQSGVTGTPAYFVNGREHEDLDHTERLLAVLREAREKA